RAAARGPHTGAGARRFSRWKRDHLCRRRRVRRTLLWVRSFDSPKPRELPGTDGASDPFWSPDGRAVGFFAEGKLKKIDISGGPPQILCDAVNPRGGSWGNGGFIVFSRNSGFDGIFRVPVAGGED